MSTQKDVRHKCFHYVEIFNDFLKIYTDEILFRTILYKSFCCVLFLNCNREISITHDSLSTHRDSSPEVFLETRGFHITGRLIAHFVLLVSFHTLVNTRKREVFWCCQGLQKGTNDIKCVYVVTVLTHQLYFFGIFMWTIQEMKKGNI